MWGVLEQNRIPIIVDVTVWKPLVVRRASTKPFQRIRTVTVSTLPDDFSGESTCAAIHVSPSGRFVYGSNRGHDTIAAFAFNEESGKLTPVGHESTQGREPRDFAIDPTETFLLAANQDTDTIVTFRIHPQTGQLTPTGHVAQVMTPVCLTCVA